MREEIGKKVLREILLSNPFLFYYALKSPGSKPLTPFFHQAQPLYHAMVMRPVRMLIADEIGLGKTIETLAIARYLQLRGEANKILVLVPKILREQWKLEVKRTGGVPNVVESGVEVEKRLRNTSGKFTIVSIDLAKRKGHRDKFVSENWDMIIVDEVHNVTLDTQRYELVESIVASNGKDLNVVLLSATPHRGDSRDYIARLLLLDNTLTRDYKKIDSLSRQFYPKTHDTIVFRRTKRIVSELEGRKIFKDCSFEALLVDVTPQERAFLDQLDRTLQKMVGGVDKNSPEALLAVLVRKRASSSYSAAVKTISKIIESFNVPENYKIGEDVQQHIRRLFGLGYDEVEIEDYDDLDDVIDSVIQAYAKHLTGEQVDELAHLLGLANSIGTSDSKLDAVSKLVKYHLERGEKVIIFTEFKDTLDYLVRRIPVALGPLGFPLEPRNIAKLHGGMKSAEIEHEMSIFENEGKVLIATDVASEGLNLQVASVVINYEAPWTPIKLEQRIGRVWRLGQTRDTMAYTVFLATDMDLRVLEGLYKKIMNVAEAVGSESIVGAKVLRPKDLDRLWESGEEIGLLSSKISSEYEIIWTSLKGRLDNYTSEIINTIHALRQELETRNILPSKTKVRVKDWLLKVLDEKDIRKEDVEEVLRSYISNVLGKPPVGDVSNILYGILTDDTEKEPIRIAVKSERKLTDKVMVLRLVDKTGKREIHRYPLLIRERSGSPYVLKGTSLVKYLEEILEKDFVILGKPEHSTRNPGSLKRIGIEKIYSIRRMYDNYDRFLLNRSLKSEPLFEKSSVDYEVLLEILNLPEKEFKLVKIKSEISQEVLDFMGLSDEDIAVPSELDVIQAERNFLPLESIAEAEKRAMELVMDLEERLLGEKYGMNKKGDLWKVEDVSLYRHYDILVEDKKAKSTKYIEVKGHLPLILQAEITTKEFEFAKRHPKEYWVYIVANLSKKPIIIKINNLFSSNRRVYAVKFDDRVISEFDVTNKVKVEIIVRHRNLIKIQLKDEASNRKRV